MKRLEIRFEKIKNTIYLSWFLAYRQIKRSSRATTFLIVCVMSLTFLNLVVVRGILVGLLEGVGKGYRENYAGDILITTQTNKKYIDNSTSIIEIVKSLPEVKSYSYRYVEGSQIQGHYKDRENLTDDPDFAAASIVGIDPAREESVSDISKFIIAGRFLNPEDTDGIVLGANMIRKYLDVSAPNITLLEDAEIGDKLRVIVGGKRKEFTLVGILKSKTDEIDFRAFVLDQTLKPLIEREDSNVDEIAIRLVPGTDPVDTEKILTRSGVGKDATIKTYEEAIPKFLKDVQKTFAIIGDIVGSIGLVVASITIFIVIFINAITRRKYIGILKGIGIDSGVIELAYVIQSFFYAVTGIFIGVVILYGFLVPYINVHPLRFPFSDGVLSAAVPTTLVRIGLLLLATMIAGYIPARLVVKQNTLNAILGRK